MLRDERGQTAPEFITTLAVVAVIVALLVGSGIAAVARGSTQSTVCRVLNDDDCDRAVALAAPAEQPAPAAPARGPENYARVPQPSLGQAAEQAAGRPLTGLECAALATYDPSACGSPRAPGPLTDDEIRQLYIAFGGEAGAANQLLCGVDVFFAESGDLAGACEVLREVTGTTAGDEAIAALEQGLRQAIELERNLPLGDELIRALEIAMGETIDGEPLSNAQRLRNLLAIAASILPADEVAQLAAIARRGNADEVAAHVDDALGRASREADELEAAVARGDDFLEEHDLWTPGKPGDPLRNAVGHYQDHGHEFSDVTTSVDYVRKAHDFLRHPPPGTLTKVRSNGDVIRYHEATNTFAVMDANGTPRTMFKPPEGLAYFERQSGTPWP